MTVTEPDTYAQYQAGFGPVFTEYEGRVVGFSEDAVILEGEWAASRTVIIQFPSREAALEWYQSDAYQELIATRQSASIGDLVLIDGR